MQRNDQVLFILLEEESSQWHDCRKLYKEHDLLNRKVSTYKQLYIINWTSIKSIRTFYSKSTEELQNKLFNNDKSIENNKYISELKIIELIKDANSCSIAGLMERILILKILKMW